MAHPNEELLRRGYDAFSTGDMATLGDLFSDDIAWHIPGRSPLAGDYNGKERVFGLFSQLLELSEGTFRVEIHDVLASDEHGVVLAKVRGQRGGKTLEGNDVHVWHLRDGKAVEFWGHSGDQYAVDEFWS